MAITPDASRGGVMQPIRHATNGPARYDEFQTYSLRIIIRNASGYKVWLLQYFEQYD